MAIASRTLYHSDGTVEVQRSYSITHSDGFTPNGEDFLMAADSLMNEFRHFARAERERKGESA